MAMHPSSDINDLNLHEVEDYSSDVPHDQLPSVEEARFAAGVTLRKASSRPPSRKKVWYVAFGLVALTLLIVAIAVPISNSKTPSGDEQIGNSVKKAVHQIALNGRADFKDNKSYQSFAKRWLMEDDLVKDYTYDKLQQRYAMYSLYHATNPAEWVDATGWKRKGVPECDWYGVSCNPSTGMVTRISLRNNGLRGEIPPEVSLIPELVAFNVRSNEKLKGTIPDHICDLHSERNLDVKVDCESVSCSCCTGCLDPGAESIVIGDGED